MANITQVLSNVVKISNNLYKLIDGLLASLESTFYKSSCQKLCPIARQINSP